MRPRTWFIAYRAGAILIATALYAGFVAALIVNHIDPAVTLLPGFGYGIVVALLSIEIYDELHS